MTYSPRTTQTKEEGVHFKSNRRRLSLVLLVVAAGAALIAANAQRCGSPRSKDVSGKHHSLGRRAPRPVAEAYIKIHPNVH